MQKYINFKTTELYDALFSAYRNMWHIIPDEMISALY